MSETIDQSFQRLNDPARARCPNQKRRGELVAIAKTLLPWKPKGTAIFQNTKACRAEIARREAAAEKSKADAIAIAKGKAIIAASRPAPTPTLTKQQLKDGLWSQYRELPVQDKRPFYLRHQATMDA